MCINGIPCLKMVTQVWMMNDLNTCPHPLLMENNEWDHTIILNNWQVTNDIVVQHLHISYGSADEFIHYRYAFKKFVHDGFQNNSPKSISTTDWQTAKAYNCNCLKSVTFLRHTVSLVTRCGFTTTSHTANIRVWEGNIRHCQSQWRWKQSHQEGNWCWHFFGSHKDQFSFTIKRAAQQQTEPVTVRCSGTGRDELFEQKARSGDHGPCMLAQQYPYTHCLSTGNWIPRCWSILYIILIWPLQIITFDPLRDGVEGCHSKYMNS